MKALVKYQDGPGNMDIRDIPEPQPAEGQVKIEIKEAGICGSDLHIYNSDIAIPVNPPVVPGHEFSGVVAAVGTGVTKFKPGDRVVAEAAYYYCRDCRYCRQGFYNLCIRKKSLGYWFDGAFEAYTIAEEANVHLLPDEIDFVSGAMLEPLACCTHAVYDCCHIEAGDVVLVSGPGAIGLIAAQIAKAEGAEVVITGTAADKERLEKARELGIHHAVDIQEEDIKEFIDALTDGYGADVVLECSGSEPGIQSGLELIKKRGYYCQIGLTGKPITFDIEQICYKEIHFSGSMASTYLNWEKGIKLVRQGLVRLSPLLTHRVKLEEWEKAFQMFRRKEGIKLFLDTVQN